MTVLGRAFFSSFLTNQEERRRTDINESASESLPEERKYFLDFASVSVSFKQTSRNEMVFVKDEISLCLILSFFLVSRLTETGQKNRTYLNERNERVFSILLTFCLRRVRGSSLALVKQTI